MPAVGVDCVSGVQFNIVGAATSNVTVGVHPARCRSAPRRAKSLGAATSIPLSEWILPAVGMHPGLKHFFRSVALFQTSQNESQGTLASTKVWPEPFEPPKLTCAKNCFIEFVVWARTEHCFVGFLFVCVVFVFGREA